MVIHMLPPDSIHDHATLYAGLVLRKTVFGACSLQVRGTPSCTTIEASYRLHIDDINTVFAPHSVLRYFQMASKIKAKTMHEQLMLKLFQYSAQC